MEKEMKIKAWRYDITTLVIYGELDNERYAESWLALCNNKREEKDFIELQNYYDSNKIKAVIDITESDDKERAKEHYEKFFSAWGLTIESSDIEKAIKYEIVEFDLNEDIEKEIYIRKVY